jgi:hypothetical protein
MMRQRPARDEMPESSRRRAGEDDETPAKIAVIEPKYQNM